MRELKDYCFDEDEPLTQFKLNKLFRVGDILPGSFIAKMHLEGRDIPVLKEEYDRGPHGYRLLYKPKDIIAAAKREGLKINESRYMSEERERLFREEQMRREYEQSQERLEHLHELAFELLPEGLSSRGLLNESEIVEAARSHPVPSGVYFLCDAEAVVYVGQSVNIPARIRQHETDGLKEFSAWAYVACPPHALNILETLYIVTLKPKYNQGKDGRLHTPMAWDTLMQTFWSEPECKAAPC